MPSPHECLHPLVLRIQVMSILNLRCPLCAAVFVDFEACCAVTCAVRQLTRARTGLFSPTLGYSLSDAVNRVHIHY